MIKLSDKFQEVELFIGENLSKKSNTEILKQIEKKFKFNIFVDHAKDLLEEFKEEIRLDRNSLYKVD